MGRKEKEIKYQISNTILTKLLPSSQQSRIEQCRGCHWNANIPDVQKYNK